MAVVFIFCTVAYGIQRMNREVSQWMRGHCESGSDPHIPFIATTGYDSVVWNRLYSKDISDFDASQIQQASFKGTELNSFAYMFATLIKFELRIQYDTYVLIFEMYYCARIR